MHPSLLLYSLGLPYPCLQSATTFHNLLVNCPGGSGGRKRNKKQSLASKIEYSCRRYKVHPLRIWGWHECHTGAGFTLGHAQIVPSAPGAELTPFSDFTHVQRPREIWDPGDIFQFVLTQNYPLWTHLSRTCQQE